MHDIKWIRDNPDAFDAALARRGLPKQAQHLISIDGRRRAQIRVFESWTARLNAASKKIGEAKARKDDATVKELMAEVAECKNSMATLETEQTDAAKELDDALAQVPNLPLDDVPDGEDAGGNVEHHHFGAKRNYSFKPKQHFDLGEALGQMDFEAAAKLSGARFVVLRSGLARLERALSQFMLDVHTGEHGYSEVNPPLIVLEKAMFGTAQLPKFRADQFATTSVIGDIDHQKGKPTNAGGVKFDPTTLSAEDKAVLEEANKQSAELRLVYRWGNSGWEPKCWRFEVHGWLIPTAEVPLTNLVRESIVDEAQLPMRLTACTPCFRAEAGAAGKDTRGMIRQHQFTKVELVSITAPEQSGDEHERMLSCAEEILRRLGLHYRVVTLCTGDMGFAAQKTYDIEIWLPGQNMYREISSCSVCGDFQARRMNARYRPKGGNPRFVHTLNGSGVAVGRALIAVMETCQQENGSIAVPAVLQSYMGGMKTIERR